MGNGLFDFESRKEKYLFFGIITVLVLMGVGMFSPAVKGYVNSKLMGDMDMGETSIGELSLDSSKTPKDYYNMFQCSCCGKSIDANCCGMAKQRKEYLDTLIFDGVQLKENIDDNGIMFAMVKKFGFDTLMDPSREEEIRAYMLSQASDNPPKIEIKNPSYDFGTINQKDGIVSTTFTIKNTGESDLVIENMDTSCMCTSAKLVYNGEESPEFGMSMHGTNPQDFELRIPPGDSAELKVFYDPMAHGVQKNPESTITRTVSVISNDPVDFQKKVKIELTQLK